MKSQEENLEKENLSHQDYHQKISLSVLQTFLKRLATEKISITISTETRIEDGLEYFLCFVDGNNQSIA